MKPSIGRIVHYCLGSDSDGDILRPAIIVRVWNEDEPFTCNLQVFFDGSNDSGMDGATHPCPGVEWRTSISMGTSPGTWRWPARA